ncbi:hypothetical protein GCM10010218_46160 [Streptomyces mashuensis]|uniref:Multisubunit sodium/proton antiporter MrpF subunit n=1 Tax=Streptomyces mashuensis TaxID=33904 RepID=A0A919B693_9ACTN|nr:MrpF/PhaF family protein [Streptomyces mashuensis]GHF59414.1 hypothetical protein GCM10010218_46160 [Streptomyces mashuensis]
MNGWLVAAAVLTAGGLGPCLWAGSRGTAGRRVAAQNMATLLLCLDFLLLAQGYGRPSYVDLALVTCVLGPAGTLVFVRLLAEELHDEPEGGPPGARLLTPVTLVATPATVLPLCVATGPGRAMAKLLVIGVLLGLGATVTTRALRHG